MGTEQCLVNVVFVIIILLLLRAMLRIWDKELQDMAQKAMDDLHEQQELEKRRERFKRDKDDS